MTKIFFLHIPKAGGTTLSSVLSIQYGAKKSYLVQSPTAKDYLEKPLSERASFRLVKGHFRFGIHGDEPPIFRYVTMLRDPIQRLVSLYNHDKFNADGIYHCEACDLDIIDFFEAGYYSGEVNDGQCRRVAGLLPDEVISSKGMLELALTNINKHFVSVGLLEYFDESMCDLASTLGWKLPPISVPAMVNSQSVKSAKADVKTLEFLREKTQIDQELYDCILARNVSFYGQKKTRRQVSRNRFLSNLAVPVIQSRRYIKRLIREGV